jgi:hypothetical protein
VQWSVRPKPAAKFVSLQRGLLKGGIPSNLD